MSRPVQRPDWTLISILLTDLTLACLLRVKGVVLTVGFTLATLFNADFLDGGKLPARDYLINFSLLLTLVLQFTAAVVYQSLSTAVGSSRKFSVDLIQSLGFNTYFWYYSMFLTLKIIGPKLCPIHWLTISGMLWEHPYS